MIPKNEKEFKEHFDTKKLIVYKNIIYINDSNNVKIEVKIPLRKSAGTNKKSTFRKVMIVLVVEIVQSALNLK